MRKQLAHQKANDAKNIVTLKVCVQYFQVLQATQHASLEDHTAEDQSGEGLNTLEYQRQPRKDESKTVSPEKADKEDSQ